MAIVHIDGNSMGQRFAQCETLAERRKLSDSVDRATKNAFEKLLKEIINHMDYFTSKGSGFEIHKDKDDGKLYLPIRSIVLSGDDITFVTEGRLGVHLAAKFTGYFTACFAEEHAGNDEPPFSACAGVVITRTKYPFFRGY